MLNNHDNSRCTPRTEAREWPPEDRRADAVTDGPHVELPNTPDAMERCDAAGAATIGPGEGPAEAMPQGRWPGYTVVIIPDGHLMSDATITQENRPEVQIELQPFVAVAQDAHKVPSPSRVGHK